MKIGIFIGRMQPLHIGHESIIKEMLLNNEKNIIMLGGNDVIDDDNPYTFTQRKHFIELVFGIKNQLSITQLFDTPSDSDWIKNIIKILETHKIDLESHITIYCGDTKNDYAIQVLKRYNNLMPFSNISFKEVSRKKINISATQVRKAITSNDSHLLEQMLDKKILVYILNK